MHKTKERSTIISSVTAISDEEHRLQFLEGCSPGMGRGRDFRENRKEWFLWTDRLTDRPTEGEWWGEALPGGLTNAPKDHQPALTCLWGSQHGSHFWAAEWRAAILNAFQHLEAQLAL